MQIIANSTIFKYYWISDRYDSQDEDEDLCHSTYLITCYLANVQMRLCVTDCERNPTE